MKGPGEVFQISPNIFGPNDEDPINLTVSSQLQLECIAAGMRNVYTMNKSFRAEKSSTCKHVSEFMHVEAELSFIDMDELINFTEKFVGHCIQHMLSVCGDDYDFLDSLPNQMGQTRRDELRKWLDTGFTKNTLCGRYSDDAR